MKYQEALKCAKKQAITVNYPVDERILASIYSIISNNSVLEDYFANGHCYDFAKLIQVDYPNSVKIVWHRFYGHILLMDKNGTLYDAHGIYDHTTPDDPEYPDIEILDWMIKDFSHQEFDIDDLSNLQYDFYDWCKNDYHEECPALEILDFTWIVSKLYAIIFKLKDTPKYKGEFDYDVLVPELVARVWDKHPEIIDELFKRA